MLSKGCGDERWVGDLPNRQERETIWAIQIAKYWRDPKEFGLRQLAMSTDGLTGSEVEQVFIESLYHAFDHEQEPTDLTVGEILVDFVPLSRLMAEQIAGLRQWAQGRARVATTPRQEKGRRIT